MLKFYFVRHGETLFNVIGRSQGQCDSPLTLNGVEQAEIARDILKNINFDYTFSSSSERAIDTANIIVKDKRQNIIPLKGLKEMSFGDLEGSSLNDGDEMRSCWLKKDFRSHGGENIDDVLNRIKETFNDIVCECKDGSNILIVSHRGYFYYMIEALFGGSVEELFSMDEEELSNMVPNGSVAIFEYEDGKYNLVRYPSIDNL